MGSEMCIRDSLPGQQPLPVEITPETKGPEPRRAVEGGPALGIQQGHSHLHQGFQKLGRVVRNGGEEEAVTACSLAYATGEAGT